MLRKILLTTGGLILAFIIGLFALGYASLRYRIVPRRMIGKAMEPAIRNGAYIATKILTYEETGTLNRGDIVVYHPPQREVAYVQRIVGMPNDTLMINQEGVHINGNLVRDGYLSGVRSDVPAKGFLQENELITVPADSFFMMGDNRPLANDSRKFGFISRTNIEAKYLLCYWNCR